jgi:hypothetical protein
VDGETGEGEQKGRKLETRWHKSHMPPCSSSFTSPNYCQGAPFHRVNNRVVCTSHTALFSLPDFQIYTKPKRTYICHTQQWPTNTKLNNWIEGFDSILKRMTIDNFNWFLYIILFYYTRNVFDKIKAKKEKEEKKNTNTNNNNKNDNNDNDNNDDFV